MKQNYLFLIMLAFLSLTSQGQETEKLKDVTFGFAAGFSKGFKDIYDYSLSQGDYSLQRQKLNRGAFVISSMISIKLTPLEFKRGDNQMQTQKAQKEAGFLDRLSLNVGLNLMEISNSVQFNKSIDGGIGLGFYVQRNTQIAIMLEASSVRQIRESVENQYLGKQIPKENAFYNALDRDDDNLFYNKYVTGLACKIVFSL